MSTLFALPENVRITSVKFTMEQDNDCCDSESLGQYMDIETQDGFLTISTKRWAIDDTDFNALSAVFQQIMELTKAKDGK